MKRSRKSYAIAELEPRPKTLRRDSPDPQPLDSASAGVCYADRLPDHLVVRIFKHLDNKVIAFLLPQVCKRWSALAKSEDLWRNRFLFYDPYMSASNKMLFFKCLRMVPVLHALTLELELKDAREIADKFYVNSPREISALHFIYDNMPPDIMFTLLEKHKEHIETLMISDTYTPYVDSDVRKIWKHIHNLSKLKHLIVDGCALFYHRGLFRKNAPCWKTLRILDIKECSYEDMNTVQRLISVNPNWVEVYLATTQSNEFRGEVKALCKCANLETVQLPFCKEFKYLLNCDKLDSIIIDCVKETEKEVSSIVSALSKATYFPNLKKVKMIGVSGDYVKLLSSLVHGHPEICLLNLVSCDMSSNELLGVLKSAPDLEGLYLFEMKAEAVITVVDEVVNGSLPKLKKLGVLESACEKKVCVKVALSQLQEEHPNMSVSQDVVCSCKPSKGTVKNNFETGQVNLKAEKLPSTSKQNKEPTEKESARKGERKRKTRAAGEKQKLEKSQESEKTSDQEQKVNQKSVEMTSKEEVMKNDQCGESSTLEPFQNTSQENISNEEVKKNDQCDESSKIEPLQNSNQNKISNEVK